MAETTNSITKKLTTNNGDTNHHHYGTADVVLSTTSASSTTTPLIIKKPLSYTEQQSSCNSGGDASSPKPQWLVSSLRSDDHDSQRKKHDSPLKHFFGQIPAILLVGVLNLMIGIPFGVSYFPIEWTSDDGPKQHAADEGGGGGGDGSGVGYGAFPLPEKDALGIRMFLFSSIVGQIIFAYTSSFKNAVGMQMVENVPFCHSLAYICIEEQGYGREALSTLFFLFGFSSVIVGLVFFALGYWEMGRVVYFFPNHVLIGCIGGIGVFVMKVGIEVGTNAALSLSSIITKRHLLSVVLAFEIVLRILLRITRDANGKARFPLLAPIYYCAITPVFYAVIVLGGMSFDDVQAAGYFFDPLGGDDGSSSGGVFDGHLFDIWRVLDFRMISWTAVAKSVPTLISLAAFSLIHVPINIPAFAISTNAECDMNKELRSHGYSNFFAGVLGGLQNYLCYANSVLYAKSNGEGKLSSLLICLLTGILFVIGPSIASYIPRCMAGTLLLHVGIDLFLEGVYDSYDMFDKLEYAGIWFITIVMTMYGMSAALLAGIIAALSTYAVQSVTYLNPVRGAMTATTLRSSRWKRSARENAILDDRLVGRKKIYVIQLHGHIFFGNVTQLTEKIESVLKEKIEADDDAWIVIIDFTLVLGIDSSAAHAILKLNEKMHKKYHVYLNIFVTGSNDGFPCEYDLSRKLSSGSMTTCGDHITSSPSSNAMENHCETTNKLDDDSVALLRANRRSSIKRMDSRKILLEPMPTQPTNKICTNLDEALMQAEDALINLYDPTLIPSPSVLVSSSASSPIALPSSSPLSFNDDEDAYLKHEKDLCLRFLSDLCPKIDASLLQRFITHLTRQVYHRGDIIWYQGSQSHCLKILVKGTLLSILEDEAGTTEDISTGNVIGELGLVNNTDRLSTVTCDCRGEAVLYNLERDVWERLLEDDPKAARCVYEVAVHYLAHRVQHVSNRIFETRCLPV